MSFQVTFKKKYYCIDYDRKDNISQKINSMKTELDSISQDIIQRVLMAMRLIQNKFFRCAFGTDSISTILNYLEYILSEFNNIQDNTLLSELDKEFLTNIWDAIYTLFNIFTNNDVQLFLHTVIIESSYLENDQVYKRIYKDNYKELSSCQVLEIIIFKDADLYAAVNQLNLIKGPLNKIWIQESIRAKFVWIFRKWVYRTDGGNYTSHLVRVLRVIRVFRTKQELLIPYEMHKMNIVSIWSEDILTAKNLAASSKSDIIFINTYMDFSADVVLLPYNRILGVPLHTSILYNTVCTSIIEDLDNDEFTDRLEDHEGPIYDLYYDGTWQKPVAGRYWIDDDCLWANATTGDIQRCIDSAKKGFEIWSTWSMDSRIQTLFKLASILKYKGKSNLSQVVLSWIKLPHLENVLSESLQCGRFDVTTFCEPRGVIVLACKSDVTLFSQLIQSLVMGNSVIIICNRFSATALPWYYDIFSMSPIPPGVINVLSCANMPYTGLSYLQSKEIKDIMSHNTRQRKVMLSLE